MKTPKNLISLLSILAILFTVNLHASAWHFTDEAYIDDIPFSTKKVYDDVMSERNLQQFDFEEEAYIDDIPFNTECVSAQCFYQRAIKVNFDFEEESYIDDIPFDTYQNVVQSAYNTAIGQVFNFSEEAYIDDIPLEIFRSEIRVESMQLVLNKKCE